MGLTINAPRTERNTCGGEMFTPKGPKPVAIDKQRKAFIVKKKKK
jgi:hypothetical protein